MTFLDKVSETFTSKSKDVVDKAKDLKGIVTLTNQISAQENLIHKYYKELGQYLYEHKDEENAGNLAEWYELIDEAHQEVAVMKKELLKKKGLKACERCGHEMAAEDAFCSRCGAPAPAPEPEEEKEPEATVEESAAAEAESAAQEAPVQEPETVEASQEACPECEETAEEEK